MKNPAVLILLLVILWLLALGTVKNFNLIEQNSKTIAIIVKNMQNHAKWHERNEVPKWILF